VDSEILTPRLRIRPWNIEDLTPLSEVFEKPEVWWYPFGRGFTRDETEAFLRRKIDAQKRDGVRPGAAEERGTGRLLGYITLSPPDWLPEVMPTVEIGWRLDPTVWGQGLASEGAAALLAYGFDELALPEILSIYEPDNVASGRVMEKIGMRFERDTVHPFFGRPLRIYRLSRQQWQTLNTVSLGG
jgi:RimJ/RimL family protein N-acetyltransferase